MKTTNVSMRALLNLLRALAPTEEEGGQPTKNIDKELKDFLTSGDLNKKFDKDCFDAIKSHEIQVLFTHEDIEGDDLSAVGKIKAINYRTLLGDPQLLTSEAASSPEPLPAPKSSPATASDDSSALEPSPTTLEPVCLQAETVQNSILTKRPSVTARRSQIKETLPRNKCGYKKRFFSSSKQTSQPKPKHHDHLTEDHNPYMKNSSYRNYKFIFYVSLAAVIYSAIDIYLMKQKLPNGYRP
jgi:hypothetical protein